MTLPKILITGSMGRIGTILTEGLADSFDIYGFDRVASQTKRTFRVDISDYAELENAFLQIAPVACVIHLAADPRIGADWGSILKNNIVGTKNLYEAARNFKVKKVVFASSNHVTGGYEGIPPVLDKLSRPEAITIRHPLRPDSDYGTSKVFGETVARQYYELFAIRSICLRIGSVLKDDNPTGNERQRRIWLSHRDLIQLFRKSILSEVEFGIYYGISNNKDSLWDISNAKEELGYDPEDDSSVL